MSLLALILGSGQTLHTHTYTANGTATWPAGVKLSLDGIGGARTFSASGYAAASYPTLSTNLGGKETTSGHTYVLPVTATGYPASVDTSGTGLSGSNVGLAWPGGYVTASDNPAVSTYFDAFTNFTFQINTVNTGGGVTAYYLGDVNFGGGFILSDYSPGNPAGALLADYNIATGGYAYGPSATLVVNGVTKIFLGQDPAGANTHTTYSNVATGATVSGTITVPSGGSVVVSYYA